MPPVEVPSDDVATLVTACAGSTFSIEVESPAGSEIRISTSPSVSEGEVIKEGRTSEVVVPDGSDEIYAKAYNTGGGPATVYVNEQEGPGLAVERQSPTVIDRIRESITVESSSSALFDKFGTFEFTGNYSHQIAPSWNFIGEIGITVVSAEMAIEISAADGDSDQFAFDSPLVLDSTEVDSFKLHDPNANTPRVVGWYAGVDS